MSELSWVRESHGSGDYGFRADGAYVGRSPKKWWRLYLADADGTYRLQPGSYSNAESAKAAAQSREEQSA